MFNFWKKTNSNYQLVYVRIIMDWKLEDNKPIDNLLCSALKGRLDGLTEYRISQWFKEMILLNHFERNTVYLLTVFVGFNQIEVYYQDKMIVGYGIDI